MNEIVLLPIGSYEYHGELLPYDTDSIIATRVAESIAELLDNATVLPVVNYGMSFEHIDFPLTASIDTNTYHDYIMNIINSIACPGRLILLINAHGGNSHMMSIIETDYNYRHIDSKVIYEPLFCDRSYEIAEELLGEFDSHAGSVEASLLAYYNDSEMKIIKDRKFIKPLSGALRFFRNIEVGPTGVIKSTDTICVDPIVGKDMHKALVMGLVDSLKTTLPKLNKQIKNVKSNRR